MPSKNSINRPKNKNTARAKAQHKSAVARRSPQTAIIHGKIDSKKVAQKKLRRARLAKGIEDAVDQAEGDVEMIDREEGDKEQIDGLDTKAKKELRKQKIQREQKTLEEEKRGTREFKMSDDISVAGKGTTLGGPPQ